MTKGNNVSAWVDADRKARREKEEHQKKLAQLGARVVEVLTCQPWPGRPEQAERLDFLTMIETTAEQLGLLPTETPEEERRTPLDEERASFHRETLERANDE